MGRAPCCDKSSVKKGPWSPEEDRKLKEYIEKHGTGGNWIALPQKAGLKRCGKSCRLIWLNYLRPNIKHGEFSDDEDRIICSIFASIGSRWSIMASQLPGRTDNDIKNYWNTKLKKKILGVDAFHKKSQQITSSTHVRPSENVIFNTNSSGFTSSVRQINSTSFTEGNAGHVGFASLIAVKDEVFIFEGNQVTSGSESMQTGKQLNHGFDQEGLEGPMHNGFYDKEMLLNGDELERRNQVWGEDQSESFFHDIKPMSTSFDYNMFLNNRNPVTGFQFPGSEMFYFWK